MQHLNRNTTPIKMRNYGRVVQDMIAYACTVEDPQEREALEVYIATCMRQRNLVWNRDQEAGIQRVKDDLLSLSEGKLKCDSPTFEHFMTQLLSQQSSTQKKKHNK